MVGRFIVWLPKKTGVEGEVGWLPCFLGGGGEKEKEEEECEEEEEKEGGGSRRRRRRRSSSRRRREGGGTGKQAGRQAIRLAVNQSPLLFLFFLLFLLLHLPLPPSS